MGRYVAGRRRVSRAPLKKLKIVNRVRFTRADWAELLEPKPLVYERKKEESSMTEEEERELAELMSDDE